MTWNIQKWLSVLSIISKLYCKMSFLVKTKSITNFPQISILKTLWNICLVVKHIFTFKLCCFCDFLNHLLNFSCEFEVNTELYPWNLPSWATKTYPTIKSYEIFMYCSTPSTYYIQHGPLALKYKWLWLMLH